MYVMVKFSLTFPLQDLPPFLIHALIFFLPKKPYNSQEITIFVGTTIFQMIKYKML